VFLSDAFLESLDNVTLSRFTIKCVVDLYNKKVAKIINEQEQIKQALQECKPEIVALDHLKKIISIA
jgi:hypothetical protein